MLLTPGPYRFEHFLPSQTDGRAENGEREDEYSILPLCLPVMTVGLRYPLERDFNPRTHFTLRRPIEGYR